MRPTAFRLLKTSTMAAMAVIALALVAVGCKGGGMKLGDWGWGDVLRARVLSLERVPQVSFLDDYTGWVEGNVLKVRVTSIERVQEVWFQDVQRYKVVRPKEQANELVLLYMDVFNRSTDAVPLSLDSGSLELVQLGGEQLFRPVDPFTSGVVAPPPAAPSAQIQFLWGDFDLGKELYLSGYVVFEVPKGTAFRRLNWHEADPLTVQFRHRVVRPQEEGNELVVVQMDVVNYQATKVFLSITSKAIELGERQGYMDYKAVDPFTQSVGVEEALKDVGKYVPFLWGPVEFQKDYQISGWVIFEVPKGTKFRRVVWREGDTVYMEF